MHTSCRAARIAGTCGRASARGRTSTTARCWASAASRSSASVRTSPSSGASPPDSRKAGGRLRERASVARPDDRAERRQNEEGEDDQADEQSLFHVLQSRLQDGLRRYGFPYFRVRRAGESSTLPSAFSIFSTSTSIPAPSRKLPPPRRPTRAVPSSLSSK